MTCNEYNDFVRKAKIVKDDICLGMQCCNCELKDPYSHHPCYVSNSGFTEEQFNFIKNYDLTDWSKVPIDAKILVWNEAGKKEKRHFCKLFGDKVLSWPTGKTSFTATGLSAEIWEHAELYNED